MTILQKLTATGSPRSESRLTRSLGQGLSEANERDRRELEKLTGEGTCASNLELRAAIVASARSAGSRDADRRS